MVERSELRRERSYALLKGGCRTHARQPSLCGAEYENGNDNENGVEMPFAGSKPPRSSAPIRLKIYRCLVF